MKQKNRLASRLYIIASVAFFGTVLFAAHIIFCDIFITPTSDFTTVPNHNYGYSIPVDIQLNQPGDMTLKYYNDDRSKGGEVTYTPKYSTLKDKEEFERALNDSNFEKKLTVDRITVRDNNLKVTTSEFDNINIIKAKGHAVINPQNFGFKLLLAIRDYLFLLALLWSFWLIRAFFKSLKDEFSFSAKTSRRLLLTGNVILCYQVINWLLCVAIKQFYISMTVVSDVVNANLKTEMYTLYADAEFNLGLVILSLSLIVISRLLNYGHDLQEENELTI
jgi:hypothetical protein